MWCKSKPCYTMYYSLEPWGKCEIKVWVTCVQITKHGSHRCAI